jgi:hypothetical protein
VRQRYDVKQSEITLSPLDPADIVAVQVSEFCQAFLGKTALNSQLAYALAKQHARVRGPHLLMVPIEYYEFYTL